MSREQRLALEAIRQSVEVLRARANLLTAMVKEMDVDLEGLLIMLNHAMPREEGFQLEDPEPDEVELRMADEQDSLEDGELPPEEDEQDEIDLEAVATRTVEVLQL
jgi:hypothetical protein